MVFGDKVEHLALPFSSSSFDVSTCDPKEFAHLCAFRCVYFQRLPHFDSSPLCATLTLSFFHLSNKTERMNKGYSSGGGSRAAPGAADQSSLQLAICVDQTRARVHQLMRPKRQTRPPEIVPVLPISHSGPAQHRERKLGYQTSKFWILSNTY